jgi:hypothetical protein
MITGADELIQDWESIWQGYFLGEHDETLLAREARVLPREA